MNSENITETNSGVYKVDFEKPCHAHFIGIGGVSMSGLAEILNNEGFTVSGSDMKESDTTRNLEKSGIKVFIGQVASNISDDIDFVVYTAAISNFFIINSFFCFNFISGILHTSYFCFAITTNLEFLLV